MPEDLNVSFSFPGERLAIAIIDLIKVIVEGQPPEVKKQLWDWWIQDYKELRALVGKK
jgi:hypothetical protein